MRDFPIFNTDTGVSSLLLKEVPYRKTAYIRIADVEPSGLEAHLRECISFCRMVGAEHIHATGHDGLEAYPVYTQVLRMQGTAHADPEKMANLFPVTEETVSQWRQLYNEAMRTVDNASTLESREEKKIIATGGAYFIHRDGKILGIGWLEGARLLAIAAMEKGAGETVMHTLMSLIEGAEMTLEVASTNGKAIRLYQRLGFVSTSEICRWHTLL